MAINVARNSVGKIKCRVVLGLFTRPAVLRLYAPVICNSPGITACRHGTVRLSAGFIAVTDTSRTIRKGLGLMSYLPSRIGVSFKGPARRDKGTTLTTLRGTITRCHSKLFSILIATPVGGTAVRNSKFRFPNRARCVRRHIKRNGRTLVVLVGSVLGITLIAARLPVHRITPTVAGRTIVNGMHVFRGTLHHSFDVSGPHVTILSLGPRTNSGNLLNSRRGRIVVPTVRRLRGRKVVYFNPCTTSKFFKGHACRFFSKILTVCRSRKLTPFGILTVSSNIGCATNLPVMHASPSRKATCSVTKLNGTSRTSLHRTVCATLSICHGHLHRSRTCTGPLHGYCRRHHSSDSGLGLGTPRWAK